MSDFEPLVEHMRTEMYETCDQRNEEAVRAGVFQQLRSTNVVNIFNFVTQFASNQFGRDYLNANQPFLIDSVIWSSARIPTVVLCSQDSNPVSLIRQFANLRRKQDNLDSISLSTNLESIHSARKILLTAVNRGNWTVIYCSKPTHAAADLLADILTQMSTNSVNRSFRIIIVCSDMRYLAPSMMCKNQN